MPVKLISAAVALALLLAYLMPLVFKLEEVSLGVIVALGLVMMLTDLRQSLQAKDD